MCSREHSVDMETAGWLPASSALSLARAVALDLDGVLIDGMPFHVEAWRQAFETVGARVDPLDLYMREGMRSGDVVASLCASGKVTLSDRQRAQVSEAKREIYAEIFGVVPLPGGPDLARLLGSFGYSLALVTGTSQVAARRAIDDLGLSEHFSVVIDGDSVTAGKPEPDSYLAAARLLGVPAATCLAVENAPPGVASALAAGLHCLAVATYLPIDAVANATRAFATMAELSAWFRREWAVSGGRGPWLFD